MENRLKQIYEAGSDLFINKGYSRTQMKDIAKEIGLSTGMLYQYFVGKKDILSFILKCTIEPAFLEQEFEYPIRPELLEDLNEIIPAAFAENQRQFGRHLKDQKLAYVFEEMLSDAFDIISKYGVGMLIIEHNRDSLPELNEEYRQFRKQFYLQVRGYIELYIKNKSFRQVEDVFYTARAIVEILSWWGMHIRYDAYEKDSDITVEKAKAMCFDILLNAYSL